MTLSYNAILKPVKMISKGHTKVLDKWLKDGVFVKFVGDRGGQCNVDKQVNVRDITSDHHGKLMHMFSIFAVKAPPAPIADLSLCTETVECFLPSKEDIIVIQGDLEEVLVSRILCDYIKGLDKGLKRLVTKHIPHEYRWQ